MELKLRQAEPADTAALQAFAAAVIAENYPAFLGPEAVAEFLGSGASDAYMAAQIADTTLALLGGELAGVCICQGDLIDLFMVRSDLHRRGVGSRFLSLISAELFTRYDRLRIESFAANEKANAFYEKNGWQREAVRFDPEIGGEKIYYFKCAQN